MESRELKTENKTKKKGSNMFSDFRKVLKEEPNTFIQKVVPVKEDIKKGKKQFTVLLPEANVRELKILSAKLGLSQKEMINEAIVEYWLKKNN